MKRKALGDVPSRAPHVRDSTIGLNNISITSPKISLPDGFIENYLQDVTFKDIYRSLKGEKLTETIKKDRISRLLPLFYLHDNVLYYDGRLCVPRKNVHDILYLAHDNKTSGHFGYSKTLSRLDGYHWKNKSGDVYDYCRGCTTFQENKDGRTKPLGIPQPLELPTRRWGSVSMDFVTHLPTTETGFDCITTFVDRFSKRVRLVPSRGTDGATEIMNRMIGNYLRCYCAFHQTDWDRLLTTA